MKNLAHSASFTSTEKIAPSKAGIKQLARSIGKRIQRRARLPRKHLDDERLL
jgi:hypothetical protein